MNIVLQQFLMTEPDGTLETIATRLIQPYLSIKKVLQCLKFFLVETNIVNYYQNNY